MFKLNKYFIIFLIIVSFSLCCNLGFTAEKSSTGNIKGTLVDEKTEKPISNLELQIVKSDKVVGDKIFISGRSIEAKSDKNGAFVFKNVPVGKYILLHNMEQLKYGGVSAIIDVEKGEDTDLGKISVQKPI